MEQHLNIFLTLSFLTAVVAFAFAAYLYLWVKKQSTVNAKIIYNIALLQASYGYSELEQCLYP